jgi:hypothetical protein
VKISYSWPVGQWNNGFIHWRNGSPGANTGTSVCAYVYMPTGNFVNHVHWVTSSGVCTGGCVNAGYPNFVCQYCKKEYVCCLCCLMFVIVADETRHYSGSYTSKRVLTKYVLISYTVNVGVSGSFACANYCK